VGEPAVNPMERCLVLVTDIANAIDELMAKPMEKVIGVLGHDYDTPWQPTVEDDQGEALEPLTWEGWAVSAILEVLAEYRYSEQYVDPDGWAEWREDIAPLIAERIACDPIRAIAALSQKVK